MFCFILCCAVLSHSVVSNSVRPPWTVACQALLCPDVLQESSKYWSELSLPSPGVLPNTGIECQSPELVGGLYLSQQGILKRVTWSLTGKRTWAAPVKALNPNH